MSNFNSFDLFTRLLDAAIREADEKRIKISEQFAKSLHAAEYELRWLEGAYRTIELGRMARQVQDQITQSIQDQAGAAPAVWEAREHYNAERLRWRPEHSSSAFHNACVNERYEALVEICRLLDRFEPGDVPE